VAWHWQRRFYMHSQVSDLHPDSNDEDVFLPLTFDVSVPPFASWQLQPIVNSPLPLPDDAFIPKINPP